MRWIIACITGLLVSGATADEFQLNGHRFNVPAGFSVELIAGPPLTERPISAAYDWEGHMYVTESSGSNDPVKKQLQERPHRVLKLIDSNGDGNYDRRTVFADRMMFPEGILWYQDAVFVCAPPHIWKLTDRDNDGVADLREIWFDAKTLTGCANDLHGPYLGPDGWIYWCKGAFATQTHRQRHGPILETRAAHIFRRHPSGGPVESVMAGGMDNPVDVVFTPGGERIFTTTFLQHPRDGKRDGLIHAIFGGVYGKVHGVIDGHPRTGDVMPALVHLGAAAPCGLELTESAALGESYRHNLFACLFNMQKVTRHVLKEKGGTFEATAEDFLVSDQIDFHPTDVIEDRDGSLIVVDTGGWYKLCCPTSQLYKPDVLGAIYRVRRRDARIVKDPGGAELPWTKATNQQLVSRFGDSRKVVRQRSSQMLMQRAAAKDLVAAYKQTDNAQVRRNIVWTLAKLPGDVARRGVRLALGDDDDLVRQAALNSSSLWNDPLAQEQLVKALDSKSMLHRRLAAEGLGRIGNSSAIGPILAAAERGCDRTLQHALTYALIQVNDPSGTRRALARATVPSAQQVALVALDQMPARGIHPDDLRPRLIAEDENLRESAWWVLKRHTEWAHLVAELLESAHPLRGAIIKSHLTAFLESPRVQEAVAKALREQPIAERRSILEAIASSRLAKMPQLWQSAFGAILSSEPALLSELVRCLSRKKWNQSPDLRGQLQRIVSDSNLAAVTRLEAMSLIVSENSTVSDEWFGLLVDQVNSERGPIARSLASDLVARLRLSETQLTGLARAVPDLGPLELRPVLAAVTRLPSRSVHQDTIEGLLRCPSAAALSVAELDDWIKKLDHSVRDQANQLRLKIVESNQEKQQKVERILGLVGEADVRRGQEVFRSGKSSCTACHKAGYLGGTIGPDLTRIGRIRSERDLIESILYPNLSFVRSYEPVVIATTAGKLVSGVVKDETADEIVVVVDARQQIHIRTEDIEQRMPGKVSIMPQGLDKQMTEHDLASLVKFLKMAQ